MPHAWLAARHGGEEGKDNNGGREEGAQDAMQCMQAGGSRAGEQPRVRSPLTPASFTTARLLAALSCPPLPGSIGLQIKEHEQEKLCSSYS
jgi:hypothetical protein